MVQAPSLEIEVVLVYSPRIEKNCIPCVVENALYLAIINEDSVIYYVFPILLIKMNILQSLQKYFLLKVIWISKVELQYNKNPLVGFLAKNKIGW